MSNQIYKFIYTRIGIIILLVSCCIKITYSKEAIYDSIAEKHLSTIDSLYNSGLLVEMRAEIIELHNYISEQKLDSYFGPAYKYWALYYERKSNNDSTIIYFLNSLDVYERFYDTLNQGITYVRIGYNYYRQDKLDLALNNYNKGIKLLRTTNASFWKGLAHDHAGFILFKQGDYIKALQHYQLAIKEFTLLNNDLNIGKLYNKIGITYRKTKDKDKEEEAYLLSIEHFLKTDTTQSLGQVYNNLAELYIDKGMIAEGLNMLEIAKKVFLRTDFPVGLCSYYAVLGYYHSKKEPPEYDRVIEYLSKGIQIAEEYGDSRQLADGSRFLGEAYLKTNRPYKALEVLKRGYTIALEKQLEPERLGISKVLYETYKYLNNSEKALEYIEIYSGLNETIMNEDKIKEFTQLDMSFKFRQEQISDSLRQLHKNLEVQLQHEKEIQTQKRTKLVLYFTVLLIAIIAVFIFIYARRNHKLAIVLNEKNDFISVALDEKVLLLEEVHHRVKNNFQLVSSLLDLQSREIVDKKALVTISEGQSRVKAMAMIHQKLYENEDLKSINFGEYCEQLVKQLQNISPNGRNVIVKMNIGNIFFDIDTAIPIGLILNELVTNSFKYAFNTVENGVLSIDLQAEPEKEYMLIIADNGPGLPADLDIKSAKSLGLRLARRLAKQLQGTFNYNFQNGSTFSITFEDSIQRKEAD